MGTACRAAKKQARGDEVVVVVVVTEEEAELVIVVVTVIGSHSTVAVATLTIAAAVATASFSNEEEGEGEATDCCSGVDFAAGRITCCCCCFAGVPVAVNVGAASVLAVVLSNVGMGKGSRRCGI